MLAIISRFREPRVVVVLEHENNRCQLSSAAGLESLVGHLGVLAPDGRPLAHGPDSPPGAHGLFFVGYTNPLSGNLRQLAIDSRRTAKRLAAVSTELERSRLVASPGSDALAAGSRRA